MPASTTHTAYHLFSLPAELLAGLRLRIDHQPALLEPEEPSKPETAAPQTEGQGGRACNVCLNATFADVNDQRTHFRSDWHRYNVKIRMNGGHPVDETRFSQLVEALDDSLSGSASSSSEDEASDSDDRVSELIQRTKATRLQSSRTPSLDNTRNQPRSALVWFHSPPATQIGVYRSVFSASGDSPNYLTELRESQSGHGPLGRTWAVFMVAGGHFAGAIFRVSKTDDDLEAERADTETDSLATTNGEGKRKKKKVKPPKPEIEVLRHKTFHRYTTRRKQGGSQSVNDNAKSKAKSAGAQLRRYGEQALRDDIQNLLKEWVEDLNECERIWFRASWSNRRMFMSDNEGIFEKGDERIRTFPFPTRRPTQSEAIRCVNELLRVKVTHFTEAELQEQDDAYAASLPKPKLAAIPSSTTAQKPQPAKPIKPVLTPEQVSLRAKWLRALDMVERGKLDPLKGFVEKEADAIGGVDGRIPMWMGQLAGGDEDEEQARGCNLLMLATIAKQEDIVRWLLEEAGADPTLDVPTSTISPTKSADQDIEDPTQEGEGDSPINGRRTAYDLARSLEVRNTFRRAAGALPDRWDWLGRGRVPSILTAEMEAGRDEKKKARRKGLKDKIREREAAASLSREPSPPPPPPPVTATPRDKDATGPRRLGGGGAAPGEGVMGLTPEMRAKVERERRARAAEARAKTILG